MRRRLGFDLVQLTGGDPLISPHCIRAVEFAAEIGIPQVEIYTNGLALRGRTLRPLARARSIIRVFLLFSRCRDPRRHHPDARQPRAHRTSDSSRRRGWLGGACRRHLDGGRTSTTRRRRTSTSGARRARRLDRFRSNARRRSRKRASPEAETAAAGIHTGGVESQRTARLRRVGGRQLRRQRVSVHLQPAPATRIDPQAQPRSDSHVPRADGLRQGKNLLRPANDGVKNFPAGSVRTRAVLLDGTCNA